jgi:beta-lactamase class A
MTRLLRSLFLLAALTATAVPAAAQAGLDHLRAEIERVAPISGGVLGVGLVHLETGRELFVQGDVPFPMASAVKVPLAVQLLSMVDQGKLRLDSMITLKPSDLHPGSGTLTRLFDDPGVALSVRNLMELMLLISDNSATDILLKVAGGASAVNARLAALGVSGISVDRPTIALIADAVGVRNLPPESELNPGAFRALSRAVTPEERKAAVAAFYQNTKDTATPRGMAALLAKVWKGEALSPASRDLLLDIMYRCETGAARIKGLLPPDIRVAHKTGTLGVGVAVDVGIIDLPSGAGHLIVTAFVKQSTDETEAQERAIAQASRAGYDYFLFNR